MQPKDLNTDYDIPYIGGYSCDGRTIFLDRYLPDSFESSVGIHQGVHTYLYLHEMVEITMQRRLGLTFNESHRIAVSAEQVKLIRDHIPIDEYYFFVYSQVQAKMRTIYDWERIPSNLCLRPYREDSLEREVKKMQSLSRMKCKCQ